MRYAIVFGMVSLFTLILPAATQTAPTTYYVDCANGDNARDGTAPDRAWRILDRGNSATLKPGCIFAGPLNASWRGEPSTPITIGAYGEGERALIPQGAALDAGAFEFGTPQSSPSLR